MNEIPLTAKGPDVRLRALTQPAKGSPRRRRLPVVAGVLLLSLLAAEAARGAEGLGMFQGQADIGQPARGGSASFDAATGDYVLAGGGENMWFTNDAFHFVWTQVSGDFSLSAAIEWLGESAQAHRKACLMIRQGLEPGSPYVDVAVHGDGLTSLQFRDTPGGTTHEIQANFVRPARIGLRRQGEVFILTAPPSGGGDQAAGARLGPAGPFIRLKMAEPLYVGLGVCAHARQGMESARFHQVTLQPAAARTGALNSSNAVLHCALETVNVASKDRRAVYHSVDLIEAPNWARDGRSFLFNSRGHIFRLPVAGGTPEPVDTGTANRCNNDHGLSPDGRSLAISDQARPGGSRIFVLPAAGGVPRQVTELAPSYWHGWSPDGSTLAYCAERGGEFDIYTIPAEGGEERRLTTAKGLDDGPDYTADGKWIYFNSERTGSMQIWRMKPDGSDQEAVTADGFNNWFPHPSPDGKWLVFLTFEPGVTGHPANQLVRLRLMPLAGGPIQELARLFGGQGTINVSSWSPDSKQVAFVSYEFIAISVVK